MTETTWEYTIRDVSPLVTYIGNGYNSSQGSNTQIGTAWSQNCRSVCDPSAHATTVFGASVSLTFYGQEVRLFGNVTGGMQYTVDVDGVPTPGIPSGQVLVSTRMSALGYHTITIVASPSSSGGTLTFESANVVVGTGLKGATLNRNILPNYDGSIQYSSSDPTSPWQAAPYDPPHVPHTTSNGTLHQLNTIGSYSLQFSGNAISVYGFSWASSPSVHMFLLDNDIPITVFANSSLINPSTISASGLVFVRANLSGSSHHLEVKNVGVGGLLGLDYIEALNITGGTPVSSGDSTPSHPPSRHSTSSGARVGVIVGAIIGSLIVVTLIYIVFRKFLRRRGSKGVGPGGVDDSGNFQ